MECTDIQYEGTKGVRACTHYLLPYLLLCWWYDVGWRERDGTPPHYLLQYYYTISTTSLLLHHLYYVWCGAQYDTEVVWYDMVWCITWCMIWYAMLSIYCITTHYSTSMECTLHVLYYTTYLLPSLLPYHPAYLYTRARVKQNGWMDGWMDGWMVWHDVVWYDTLCYPSTASLHTTVPPWSVLCMCYTILHTYYHPYPTTSYYSTYHSALLMIRYRWMDGVSEWVDGWVGWRNEGSESMHTLPTYLLQYYYHLLHYYLLHAMLLCSNVRMDVLMEWIGYIAPHMDGCTEEQMRWCGYWVSHATSLLVYRVPPWSVLHYYYYYLLLSLYVLLCSLQ